MSTLENTRFRYIFPDSAGFFYSCTICTLDISQTVTPKPINHTISWKNSRRSIIRQMTMFLWAPSVLIFHFCISRSSKFNFMGSPLCIMFWSLKSHLDIKYSRFKPVNIDILYLHKFANIMNIQNQKPTRTLEHSRP